MSLAYPALHDYLLVGLAFISEFLGTISGFGSSTFFVPLAVLFESFQLVIVLTGILHCLGNTSRFFYFRQKIDWSMLYTLILPSILFTALGAYLGSYFQSTYLKYFLGGFLILFSLNQLLNLNLFKPKLLVTRIILIALSGFLTGIIGTGGALRGLALSTFKMSANQFIFTSSVIDLGGDIFRTGIYLAQGYMDWHQWYYIPFLFAAALTGTYFGKIVVNKVQQKTFEKIVSVFILISGLSLFWS